MFSKKICASNSSLKVTRMRHAVIQADFLPVFWILSHIHPAISEVFLDLSLYLLCFFHILWHKMAGERAVSASPVLCFVFSIVTDAFSFFQSNLCFQELFVLLYYMSVRKIFPHKWINVLCHYCSKKPLQYSPDNCTARGFIFIQKQLLL